MQDPELLYAVRMRFVPLSTAQLISRMNRAADFGYDDEEVELTQRLASSGRAWRWDGHTPERVESYDLATGQVVTGPI